MCISIVELYQKMYFYLKFKSTQNTRSLENKCKLFQAFTSSQSQSALKHNTCNQLSINNSIIQPTANKSFKHFQNLVQVRSTECQRKKCLCFWSGKDLAHNVSVDHKFSPLFSIPDAPPSQYSSLTQERFGDEPQLL